MHEADLIKGIRALVSSDPAGQVGIGDDACIWTPGGPTCLSVDGMVEGRHFTSDTPPLAVGRKAAAAAISDIAAMGARPVGATVSLHCPSHWDGLAVMQGLIEELNRHGCHCYGGDSTGAEQLVISVTVWGEAAEDGRLIQRSGASAGDLLVVTGHLGGSFKSGRHLRPEPRLAEGQWLAKQAAVTAMMDLSDGLAADAPKLAAASGCGCLLIPGNVPIHDDLIKENNALEKAFCDGEDFELLFTVDAAAWPTMTLAWPFDTPLNNVGWLIQDAGSFIEDAYGRIAASPYHGFEHRV